MEGLGAGRLWGPTGGFQSLRWYLQDEEQLHSAQDGRAWGALLAQRQEGEDLGLPKCLLHQEINSLRTGFSDEE